MKFLLDENLSPDLASFLVKAGHDAVHARDLEMAGASDTEVLEQAREQERVLVSADTDFGELLARTGATTPSVMLLRREQGRKARAQAQLILANLDPVLDDLNAGAIVVIETFRIRVRRLPVP